MMHVASLFRKYGSNIWFEKDAKELLPEGYTNPSSPNGNFTKEEDIMDVWFDSGSTHTSVLVDRGLPYPADLYLEGSDQYRGWFNSSLITGVAVYGKAPYKMLVSHGFTLDGKGEKMSKSLGNTILPSDIVRLHGSDILRLWVSSVDFTEDVKMNEEILNQVKESYRKIRNTYKFMLGNLKDFDPKNSVSYEEMPLYDKYLMIKLNDFIEDVLREYDKYSFQEIYKIVNHFVSFTLSNFYLDFTKDILYIEGKDSKVRRSVQTVLYFILSAEIRLLAPILPYTSEEVYKLLEEGSVHMCDMPDVKHYKDEEEIRSLFDLFFELKEKVNKELEIARNEKIIGSSLEAVVKVNLDEVYIPVKEKLGNILHQLFIVSKVEFTDEVSSICIEKSQGEKCSRCWNYVDHLKEDICERCDHILHEKI